MTNANPQQKQKPLTRSERRKKFIEGYLKRDRFINVRSDQYRLIIDEEQELYDFLDLMDKVLLGSDLQKPDFIDKTLRVDDEGGLILEGEPVNLLGEINQRLEEALWLLTQPEVRRQIGEEQQLPIQTKILQLIDHLCQLNQDTQPDLRRHSLATVAALALFCSSDHWGKEFATEVNRVMKETPFALVRTVLHMGLVVVESASTSAQVEQAFSRGKSRQRFQEKAEEQGFQREVEMPQRRRRRRRRRRR